jgi:hypothetical protein
MELASITKPKSIVFIDNKTVAIKGKEGCEIFNRTSQRLLHKLSTCSLHDTFHLAANKNEIIVIDENEFTVFNGQTGRRNWLGFFVDPMTLVISSSTSNIFFSYLKGTIIEYNSKSIYSLTDYLTNLKNTVPYSDSATDHPLISCHPKEKAILYPSDNKTLSIAQPGRNPLIKLHLNTNLPLCNSGEFSGDGTMIAINDNHNKYFIYDLENKDAYAYELAADDKKYVAVAFHPLSNLLALLSHDNIVQYWDYVTRQRVATTHALAKDIKQKINKDKLTKRLAFSPDGMHLTVALKNEWIVLDIPQSNLLKHLLICYTLYKNDLPQDLINLIVNTMMRLSQLNLAALSKVAPLPIPQPTDDQTTISEEPEYRSIEIVYNDQNS